MKKIWIDTDLVGDDVTAIAMLLEARKQVDIAGVSTIGSKTKIDEITRNAKALLEAAGKHKIPVLRGEGYPLGTQFNKEKPKNKMEGMGKETLSGTKMPKSKYSAPQTIVNTIMNNPQKITLLLLGALTNIAKALALEPRIADLVKEVVIMGGAVHCPGNITPAAEANFYHDPLAARIVMGAEWPIVLAGLDVCEYGHVPLSFLDKIYGADKPATPIISSSLIIFQRFLETVGFSDDIYLPDALAAGYLLAPDIFTFEEVPLYVETEGACRGMSIPVARERWFKDEEIAREFNLEQSKKPVKVLLSADTNKFLSLLEDLLT
jgi:uridine nucleosidase